MDYNALSQKTIRANILRGPSWGEQGWSEWGRRREDGSEGHKKINCAFPFIKEYLYQRRGPFSLQQLLGRKTAH